MNYKHEKDENKKECSETCWPGQIIFWPGVNNLHLRQASNIAEHSLQDTIRLPVGFYLDGLQIRYVTDTTTLDCAVQA